MKLLTYLSASCLLTMSGLAQTVTSTNLQTYSPVAIEGTISTEGPTVSTTTSRVTSGGTITTITTDDTTSVTPFGNREVIEALLSGSTNGAVPTQGYSIQMITESDTAGNIVSQGLYLAQGQGAMNGSSSTSGTSILISGSGATGFSLPQFANYVTESRQTVDTSGSTTVFTKARSSSNGIGTMTVFGDSLYFAGSNSSTYGTYSESNTVYPYACETVSGEFSGLSGSTIIQGSIQIGEPNHFRTRGHFYNNNDNNNPNGAIFGLTEGSWQFQSQSTGPSQGGAGNGWWGGGRTGGGWWDNNWSGGNWGRDDHHHH